MERVDIRTLERVASACWGARGRWIYWAFRHVNEAYFGSELPAPLVQWALTPHGKCLGMTQPEGPEGLPVVTLHPAIWGTGDMHARELSDAWGGIPACRLYALDVLIHELAHVKVSMVRSKIDPEACKPWNSSHDNPLWPAEVERISPLIGVGPVVAARTKRARRDGAMVRVPAKEGAIDMEQLATWPHSLRPRSYYVRDGRLPWE